jgi:branched-chain amino acid transport system substrate-binding protein
VVGTHVDLSGPLGQLGVAVRNGLTLAFDEINANGGINGRKVRLRVADNGYNPRKATAIVKTFLRDGVFAVLSPVGTPAVSRTMPLVLNSGTLHLFPFASVDETYVPAQPLEFAIDLPASRQAAVGIRAIFAARGPLKVGVLHRNDVLGDDVLKGATEELAASGRRPVGVESFSPGEQNFTAVLANLRAAGAELVVVGGVPQEAIAAMQQAAAANWFPVFLCDQTCYVPELPFLGGRAVAGLYTVAATPIPYPDDKDAKLRAWVRRYEQRFGTVASAQAFRAYLNARLFAEAVRRAGPDPSQKHVARVLELMSPWKDPDYGGVPVVFTPRDHVGLRTGFLAQVRNGRWTTLTGALTAGLPPH